MPSTSFPDRQPVVTVHGGPPSPPSLFAQGSARLPTGGKIRAGIKVLARRAAQLPQARAIYEEGLAQGHSFDQIEQAVTKALPDIGPPLVPHNVPWFTVRGQDFVNPALADQILALYGEERGEGRHLYRFPVVFPADRWQTVMPHELASWGAQGKRFWSAYSEDGRQRQCMTHAPVPVDVTGRRTIRLFGGRQPVQRPDNGGLCQPESCQEYQQRHCNLSGRFLFFIPGVRALSLFELHTRSFYAMSAAVRTFELVSFLRGGRLAGYLDQHGTTFFLSKRLMEVPHIDESGLPMRVPQWIIELEAPVDVATVLREQDDTDAVLLQAEAAAAVLQDARSVGAEASESDMSAAQGTGALGSAQHHDLGCDPRPPTLAHVIGLAVALGVPEETFLAYAGRRWGPGWRLNLQGRQRALAELERYRNDPQGYADKLATTLQQVAP